MRSRTAVWFETKVKYDKMQDDGIVKSTTDAYVVDALCFTEAEASIIEEMSSSISGEFNITDIKKASYKEVFFSDDVKDDRWYKAKLQYINIDEKTGKEKRQNVYFLVQAGTLLRAVNNIDQVMSKTMIDYVIASVTETKFIDVFEHTSKLESQVKEDKPEYE